MPGNGLSIDEQEVAAALIEEGQRIGLGVTECERTVASGMSTGQRSSPCSFRICNSRQCRGE
jgi:hypothetical protein